MLTDAATENCSLSHSGGAPEIQNIKRIAHKFGHVKLFKAYLHISSEQTSPRTLTMRSELQLSGVSLTDCPHINGQKEVADKMMLGMRLDAFSY